MNYLQLVQALVSELGIAGANNDGTIPSTVVAQTGQLRRAVKWITDSNNDINILWTDWKYLYTDYAETLTVGSRTAPLHSGVEVVKRWDRESFILDRSLSSFSHLSWMDWRAFKREILPGAHPTNQIPATISSDTANLLHFNEPTNSAYTLNAGFWQRPVLLTLDADLPAMPEEYHRLIIMNAGLKYANKEDAPEILAGWETEYIFMLDKLEGDQLPGREYERMSSQDIDLVMDIPDAGDDYGGERF